MPEREERRQVRPGGTGRTSGAEAELERRFLDVLGEATTILRDSDVPHVIMGGVAVAALARPRWTHDVDVFVRPDDAGRALTLLGDAGYETEETDPLWIFKAWHHDVLVDLIFRSQGGYYLDDEILERAQMVDFKGQRFHVMPPEDLLVIKAAAHEEDTPYHWFDALALLARQSLDWDYLLERSRRAVRRVLSLLVYAESVDIAVPPEMITALTRYEHGSDVLEDRSDRAPTDLAGMRERLRSHPDVAELDLQLHDRGSGLVLRGEVETERRRDDIGRIAGELFPDRRIHNRVDVRDGADGAPTAERIT